MAQRRGKREKIAVETVDFPFAEGWPSQVQDLYGQIFAFAPEEVERKDHLGEAFAFSEAPETLQLIRSILRDLAQEPWRELPTTVTGQLKQQLTKTFEVLSKMKAFSPEGRDAKAQRDRLATELGQQRDWILDHVRHHTMRARSRRAAQELLAEAGETASSIDDLAARADEINREIDARGDIVSAMRQRAGEEASKDLSRFFQRRADERGKTAMAWALGLVGMIGVSALVALVVYWGLGPDRGVSDPAAFTALGLAVLLVGLCLFGVRICAQQYRVNRHLEAVAQTKATALSTFTPLSSSFKDADVRAAVAAALAQAVFETENTGMIDASGDHVTIVERALLSRTARSGSTDSGS